MHTRATLLVDRVGHSIERRGSLQPERPPVISFGSAPASRTVGASDPILDHRLLLPSLNGTGPIHIETAVHGRFNVTFETL